MRSKVLAIDFFLMQIGKKENCSKLPRAFLITATVEPVGNVAGSKALCVFVCALHCFVVHCVMAQPLILQQSHGLLGVVTGVPSLGAQGAVLINDRNHLLKVLIRTENVKASRLGSISQKLQLSQKGIIIRSFCQVPKKRMKMTNTMKQEKAKKNSDKLEISTTSI